MKKFLVGLTFVGAAMFSLEAAAVKFGNVERGQQLAQKCVACHGDAGNSQNAQFPRIGGQYADYLLKALQDYQSGQRKNPIMASQVQGLSVKDMEDLAAYYAAQKGLYALDF